MSALDFLRDVGRHFRVNQMIRKEAVARRLESDQGISYTEFAYQMLQALDYLEPAPEPRLHPPDRWQRPVGQHHGRRRPRPPGRGHVRARARDAAARRLHRAQVRQVRGQRRLAQRRHDEPVRLLPVLPQRRGRLGRQHAQGALGPLARGDRGASRGRWPRSRSGGLPRRRSPPTSRPSSTEPRPRRRSRRPPRRSSARATWPVWTHRRCGTPPPSLPGAAVSVGTSVVDALVAVGLVDSRNAARRAIGDGGASLNNVKVTDPEQVLGEGDFLQGSVAVLKRGRRNLAAARRA